MAAEAEAGQDLKEFQDTLTTMKSELDYLKRCMYLLHPQINPKAQVYLPARGYVITQLQPSSSKISEISGLYNVYESYCFSTFQLAEPYSEFEHAMRSTYPQCYQEETKSCKVEFR